MTTDTQTTTTKPRHWFHFRLRTVLVLITLLSGVLGWAVGSCRRDTVDFGAAQ